MGWIPATVYGCFRSLIVILAPCPSSVSALLLVIASRAAYHGTKQDNTDFATKQNTDTFSSCRNLNTRRFHRGKQGWDYLDVSKIVQKDVGTNAPEAKQERHKKFNE